MAESKSLLDMFGFRILRSKDASLADTAPTFTKPMQDDGAYAVTSVAGGHYGTYFDLDGLSRNEIDQIRKYREIAQYPECDMAIQDIVNEAICENEVGEIVKLEITDDDVDPRIKKKLQREFENVVELLEIEKNGADMFRQWYTDGKLAYHIIIDAKNIKSGIISLNRIDSTCIKKVVEFEERPSVQDGNAGTNLIRKVDEYFVYSESAFTATQQASSSSSFNYTTGLKISPDTILYSTVGIVDPNTGNNLSPLYKAIRPANQLRMLEDSSMVYYMSRAPERRIFYVNVEGMSYAKAETYLNNFKNNFKNKVVYDSVSGATRDDKKFLSMQDDLWIPRTGDGKQTEVTTLAGGANLESILSMLKEFEQKLYRSLNVPISRIEQGQGFNGGRQSEITRDEVKFDKYIKKLRRSFATIFIDALRVQCILKGIVTVSDWEDIVKKLRVVYSKDNHFVEMKELDILGSRLETLGKVDNYVGTYFSREYVFTNVLGMTKDEARIMEEQIQKEKVFNPDDIKPGNSGGDSGSMGGFDSGMGSGGFDTGMDMGSTPDTDLDMNDTGGSPDMGTEAPIGGMNDTGMETIGPDMGLDEPEEQSP